MGRQKIIIYQIFTRLFGNRSNGCKPGGTIAENGSGKMSFFTDDLLHGLRAKGYSHVWYTGLIRHATTTDYTRYGIPRQHPAIVKGKAGSPYAIVDYYDIDPDLADDVNNRMQEFEQLLDRSHRAGLKVIIDFVPNHVARQYHSTAKPEGVRDLGEDDNTSMGFSAANNFYYCSGTPFQPHIDTYAGEAEPYKEFPAKATGNDHFDASPCVNDWYETVKLNYGVDYLDAGGRSEHFSPMPDTWAKMTDILMYWASKGVDGFRCDMAEMVPPAFWHWAIAKVKEAYPDIIFVAEVYNPLEYNHYVDAGMDYLYDKVGMYDTMRSVVCGNCPTSKITTAWQWVDGISSHMLYFLENHDEQRIASDFFAGDPFRAYPALVVNALMRSNPFMVYAGQEYGERGMDQEGFSGCDGRTTIFDYWTVPSLHRAHVTHSLRDDEKALASLYDKVLNIAATEKAVGEGDFFDLMYVNEHLAQRQYAFMRKAADEMLFVVANFGDERMECRVNIPAHAFDFLNIPHADMTADDMLGGAPLKAQLKTQNFIDVDVEAHNCRIYKFNLVMDKEPIFNEHNKEEFPPAHTAEHLLNQTMVRLFGCERSSNAHIERKKSKMTFTLDHKPSRKEEKMIEDRMNELIAEDLPVTYEVVDRDHIPADVQIDRLPEDASEQIRLVRIGNYDVCPCIGKHVRSTAQIGKFVMLGTNWDEMKKAFRIRFKIVQ
ncbi:alpha-amylase family glycosyl hydrolase [Prevotella sp.]|uniref:alpha-amylase family glycosyl hydrolase n=1 Tax=Prevotella sp. TaxID=59823 RepID=UPI00307B94D7